MIALKTDPIWAAISRFGVPWPLFDFGSGMGVAGVRRRDAVKLGLLEKGQRIEPVDLPTAAQLTRLSTRGISQPIREALEDKLGEIADDTVVDDGALFMTADGPAPIGPAIQVATDIKRIRIAVNHALNAQAKIHGEGVLPITELRAAPSRPGLVGFFEVSEDRAEPPRLWINPDAPVRELGFLHESAHLLSNFGFGEPSAAQPLEARKFEGLLSEVIEVATRSRRIDALLEAVAGGDSRFSPLLDPEEVWARSYAQFIAVESRDPILMQQLQQLQRGDLTESFGLGPEFAWEDDDFLPIGDAIRAVFQIMGWLFGR